MPHFGVYQNEIYFNGLSGVLPKLPVDFAALELRASAVLAPAVLNYLQGGCGDEFTQRSDADAFRHWGIVPRMMVDTTNRDLSITLWHEVAHTPVHVPRGPRRDLRVGWPRRSGGGRRSGTDRRATLPVDAVQ